MVEEASMPKLEVEGVGTFDVEEDKRLVLAIEEDAGVDIMHQCGSHAHCATCRVEFLDGEPEMMTQAELAMLMMRNLLGKARLSCQALCGRDMKVRVLMTLSSTGARGPGWRPQQDITPEPFWVEKPATFH
jgi:ferredoxin